MEDAMTVTFLNGKDAQMTLQLQYWNHVEVLFLYKSENYEHSPFKFSGIIYSWVAIKISELRCCHENQRNNTALSFQVFLRLFFMSAFLRYYSMNLIAQSCTAQIFLIVKTTCTFQCCFCTMFIRSANQTRFHWWNVIIWLVLSFEKPRRRSPDVPLLRSVCWAFFIGEPLIQGRRNGVFVKN